jgi:hypothetical protein
MGGLAVNFSMKNFVAFQITYNAREKQKTNNNKASTTTTK